MATKKQIVEDIRQQCGNLIPATKIGEYLGMCPRKTAAFLEDVPSFRTGRKKCYLAIDIANKLLSCEE